MYISLEQFRIFAAYQLPTVIHLHDKTFEPFISSDEIGFAIAEMAKHIEDDFQDEVPVFIGILNGSFMVLSDLLKQYKFPCEVEFLKLSSYQGIQSTGEVRELIGSDKSFEGRSIIIVEDIVDTGNTIETLKRIFKSHNVKSFKIATLFFKPESYKKDIKIDYVGIRIPDKFIVGYGLDYNGLGRNLSDVYQLSPQPPVEEFSS